ncbi:MAG: hypothetical protein JWO89_2567, partial [Verrucomicrobiaceae bacterium]|nr:hypothetical protein [Verrucomicrobiaceae bacterium]
MRFALFFTVVTVERQKACCSIQVRLSSTGGRPGLPRHSNQPPIPYVGSGFPPEPPKTAPLRICPLMQPVSERTKAKGPCSLQKIAIASPAAPQSLPKAMTISEKDIEELRERQIFTDRWLGISVEAVISLWNPSTCSFFRNSDQTGDEFRPTATFHGLFALDECS